MWMCLRNMLYTNKTVYIIWFHLYEFQEKVKSLQWFISRLQHWLESFLRKNSRITVLVVKRHIQICSFYLLWKISPYNNLNFKNWFQICLYTHYINILEGPSFVDLEPVELNDHILIFIKTLSLFLHENIHTYHSPICLLIKS